MSLSPASHVSLSPGIRLEAARVALATRAERSASQRHAAPAVLQFRAAQIQAKVHCATVLAAHAHREEPQSVDVLG